MTAIRKHARDVAAIIALIVIAFAVASVILANQRLALPGWVPFLGQDFTEVGHRAIAILQAAISDPDPDADIPERLIQPELVVRSSTAALGRPKRKARR